MDIHTEKSCINKKMFQRISSYLVLLAGFKKCIGFRDPFPKNQKYFPSFCSSILPRKKIRLD